MDTMLCKKILIVSVYMCYDVEYFTNLTFKFHTHIGATNYLYSIYIFTFEPTK